MAHPPGRKDELVKLADGRWARFQQLQTIEGQNAPLIAVELDTAQQQLLNEAELTLHQYQVRGVPVQVRLDENLDGETTVRFAEEAA
jgi:hypothetical protein